MELRHLRYFIAVAEEGSFTVAAQKRLYTAQPSLSRQMQDLEEEVGTLLLKRVARGVELTAAGRAFLEHARSALIQVDAATEAARRAAQPAKATFVVGFLTGYEIEWLPPLMRILHDALPSTEVVIHSQQTPELVAGLLRGRIDIAFLRPGRTGTGLAYRSLGTEPMVVAMPAKHPLAAHRTIRPRDFKGQTIIGVRKGSAPAVRELTERYAAAHGIDLTPAHEVDNPSMAFSLITSTGGLCLLPLYVERLRPVSVVSRPVEGNPPAIELAIGYSEANRSPLLAFLLSQIDQLKFQATGR
jgi:LysR family hca operon transcriptional activator